MNAALPDISLCHVSPIQTPLRWVGMQDIVLPVRWAEPGYERSLAMRAELLIDLPNPLQKGIHMSRLYRLLDDVAEGPALTPRALRQLLAAMIKSHEDCQSRSARLFLSFELLVRRPALKSAGLSGWKAYPVRLEAELGEAGFSLRAEVSVSYSSTCPCSAALARQLVAQGFREAFAVDAPLRQDEVAAWLEQQATLATPHSQRSEAQVRVELDGEQGYFALLGLIERMENALGTPVQTAVKRADEQAFAALNGQNLMFVEDAARRLQAALADRPDRPQIRVIHRESLHAHDAVAWA